MIRLGVPVPMHFISYVPRIDRGVNGATMAHKPLICYTRRMSGTKPIRQLCLKSAGRTRTGMTGVSSNILRKLREVALPKVRGGIKKVASQRVAVVPCCT